MESPVWKNVYRAHLIFLERFLARSNAPLSSEHRVYLSGMLARHTDLDYQRQIQVFLFDDLEELDETIRRHDPYLGQNAPIVTVSKINGEHLTVGIAFDRRKGERDDAWKTRFPSRCFGVASFYSRESGNRQLSDIFGFFHHHHALVLDILTDYLSFLDENLEALSDRIPPELWERFGQEINERNTKKEWWEARGINVSGKETISKAEFREMLNIGGLN